MALADGKILVHLKDRRRLVVDVHDVYYLEAQGDETDIRLRSARGLRDVRSLGEVMPATRFAALLAAWFAGLACSSERHLEVQPLGPLELADHLEQVARLRIPPGAEHPHETLGRPARQAAELLKADRGVDVVAEDCLPGIEIAGKETLHAFPQQLLSILAVPPDAGLHGFLERTRQRHPHFSCDFRCL